VLGMLDTLNSQGTTILMVTHSHEHAARAHRIIDMLDGKVLPGIQAHSQSGVQAQSQSSVVRHA
jgi:ABC-type lipoprotein export system ATPase subunit